jgi:hypothetical protein
VHSYEGILWKLKLKKKATLFKHKQE